MGVARKANIQIQITTPPRYNQILEYAGAQVLETAPSVSPDILALVRPMVSKLYERFAEKEDAVAACMALAMGVGNVRDRSLLSGRPGYTSVQFSPLTNVKPTAYPMLPIYELSGWVAKLREEREKTTRAIRDMTSSKMYACVKKNTIVGDVKSEQLPALRALLNGKVKVDVLERVPMIKPSPAARQNVSNNWSSNKRRQFKKH